MAEVHISKAAIKHAAAALSEISGLSLTDQEWERVLKAAANGPIHVMPGRPTGISSTLATRTTAAQIAATLLQHPAARPAYFLEVAADIDEWIRNGPEVTATE